MGLWYNVSLINPLATLLNFMMHVFNTHNYVFCHNPVFIFCLCSKGASATAISRHDDDGRNHLHRTIQMIQVCYPKPNWEPSHTLTGNLNHELALWNLGNRVYDSDVSRIANQEIFNLSDDTRTRRISGSTIFLIRPTELGEFLGEISKISAHRSKTILVV